MSDTANTATTPVATATATGWIADQPTFNKQMLVFYPGWTQDELNSLWARYQEMKSMPFIDIHTLIGTALTAGLNASDKVDAIAKIVADT